MVEHRKLWEALRVAGMAIQRRAICLEAGTKEDIHSAQIELFDALQKIKEMSVDLHLTVNRFWNMPGDNTHTFSVDSFIDCGDETPYSACMQVGIVYDHSTPEKEHWKVQAGDIDIDFTDESDETHETKELDKSGEDATDVARRERDNLISREETQSLLKKLGLSLGS